MHARKGSDAARGRDLSRFHGFGDEHEERTKNEQEREGKRGGNVAEAKEDNSQELNGTPHPATKPQRPPPDLGSQTELTLIETDSTSTAGPPLQ